MKKSIFNLKSLFLCAILCASFAILHRQTQAQTTSNDGSKSVIVSQNLVDNCSKALDELAVYDKLLESKEAEIKLLNGRLELEKEKSEFLRSIAEARKNEADSLTAANNALKEAIKLKESVISNQSKEIEILKKKRTSLATIIKAVAVGISISLVLK